MQISFGQDHFQFLDLFPFPVSVWENVDPDRSESHEVDDPDVGEDVGDEGGEPDDEEEQEEGGRGAGSGQGGSQVETGAERWGQVVEEGEEGQGE